MSKWKQPSESKRATRKGAGKVKQGSRGDRKTVRSTPPRWAKSKWDALDEASRRRLVHFAERLGIWQGSSLDWLGRMWWWEGPTLIEKVTNYLVAERGMTKMQVDEMTPPEVAAVLKAACEAKARQAQGPGDLEVFVTLDQMAALVNRSKRTLERFSHDRLLPAPDVRGGKGKAHEWAWSKVRPHLAELAGRELPAQFPNRHRR